MSEKNKKFEKWKRSNKTIVFTNGCFDLLHQGHIDLLCKASSYGDKLVVGINSDESVRRLKGLNRPVENEKIRKKKLMKLKFVDDVYVFHDLTPLKLIKSICPNILIKGDDYAISEIVGGDFVINLGGKVITIPLTPGYSTTSSIKKLSK